MTLIGSALDAPVDISAVVSQWARETPDRQAAVSHAGAMTWRELDESADRWAGAIRTLGLRRGDRIASLMPNCLELIVHYLGSLRAGVVAVPLNYRYISPQIDHALTVSGASAILAHAERAEDILASEIVPKLAVGPVWHGAGEGNLRPTLDGLLTTSAPRKTGNQALAWDEPALIFFTSGSTGPAKGVTHSRETLGWMVASARAALEITAEDVFLPASSMSHIGALLWSTGAFAAGAKVVVAHTVDGDEVLPLIREHRPTLLAMIPAALTALVRDHGATAADFESVRVCRSGADHVPAELETEFLALTGMPIDEGYGMTEVGLATINPPSGVIKAGSIGKPTPGFSISIRDDDGSEVAAATVGEIFIKTPSATPGYWQDADATAELIHDGWVSSGDLASFDEDGYLSFFGRTKQIIVHDGSNISPSEVEDALSQHPAIASVGVVGVHDLVHGENVRAYVTLAEGAERPSSQELIRFARDTVGYRAPEEIVFLDELPLNPTGKIDRNRLKEIAQDHRNPHRS